MKSILQNIKTGEVSIGDIPAPSVQPGYVLVHNVCSLVSAGTEKAVLEFSNANYLKKARMRPDLFRKVLNKAKNEGLWQTYKVVSELIDQDIQLGYSSAGVVIDAGPGIDDLKAGDRVACAGLFKATHSEHVCVPRNLITPVPDGVDYESASFVTLGAIAMQGVRLAETAIGEHVVVYGLGLVGMLTAKLALAAGCRVIGADIDPAKVSAVEKCGARGIFIDDNFEASVLEATGAYGADVVLLCAATSSNDPVERIPGITRQKGRLVVVGDVPMNLSRRAYYDKEIDIRVSRSYGPGRYDLSYEEGGLDYPYAYVRWTENRNMESFIDLLARGRVDVSSMITHRFDIDDALTAYHIIEGKQREPYMGMVVRYREDEKAPQVSTIVSSGSSAERVAGKVGVGIIGAGNFAKAFLLPAFQKSGLSSFRAIYTASGVSAASVASKYSIPLAADSASAVSSAEDVDAVLIATRHDSHAHYVCEALLAGKSVFVEKPLCLNKEELAEIRLAADANPGARLMVGYNRRFSPLARTLKSAFDGVTAPLAMTYRVNAGFIPRSEWIHDPIQGGGRIIGEVCHFIDFFSYLTGQNPIGISGCALGQAGDRVDDVITLTLDYPNGSMGTIHYFANGAPSMPKESVDVFAGGRCATLTNFRSLRVHGTSVSGKKYYLNQVKGFGEEAHAFLTAVREGSPSPIALDSLLSTSMASILASESLAAARRIPVPTP